MFNFLISKRFFACFVFLILLSANGSFLSADDGHSHTKKGLHFSHPLISESPSPDTKIRLDYFFFDVEGESEEGEEEEGGGFKEHTIRLEAEYAFSRNISLEVNVPYTFIDPDEGQGEDHFNNIEVGLKLASFIFEEYGLLLGGGIEFGIPAGDDEKGIGSDHVIERLNRFYQWVINITILSLFLFSHLVFRLIRTMERTKVMSLDTTFRYYII
jgi:hypothetical protein